MTDILEICARAIHETRFGYEGRNPKSNPNEDDFVIARACLTALAENVSEEMVEAGEMALKAYADGREGARHKAIDSFRSMLGAVL